MNRTLSTLNDQAVFHLKKVVQPIKPSKEKKVKMPLRQVTVIALLASALNSFAAERPNVVIIYGDDVGYGDISVNGSTKIKTPNIDMLASEGISFTDGHCTASTCSPSRFSMLTGVHDFRHRIGILSPTSPLCIATDILTLPRMFKKAGYETGIIGKWHLGIGAEKSVADWNGEVKPGPVELGFDHSFIIPSTNDRVPCVYLDGHRVVNLEPKDPIFVANKPTEDIPKEMKHSTRYPIARENPESMTYYTTDHDQHMDTVINGIGRIGFMVGGKSAIWDDETMADVFVEETKAFIRKNRDGPFFLFFSSQDIHAPRAPHKRFQGKTDLGYRGDAMVQLDWSTGEIVKTLEEHGLTENTIIVFSSDNGPVYNDGGYVDGTEDGVIGGGETHKGHDGSGIYRGGKYQIYEGGTRVPFIIRWPGKIKPGTSSNALVSQIDLLASFAAIVGVQLEENEARDSRNTLDAFLGNDQKGQDYIIEFSRKQLALRQGDWKLVVEAPIRRLTPQNISPKMLFNLAGDVGEKDNVLALHPERVEEMFSLLKKQIHKDGRLRSFQAHPAVRSLEGQPQAAE